MGYATRLRVRSIYLPQYFPSISSQNNWANSVVFFPYDPFPFFFLFLRQKPNIHLLETEHLIYPVWVMCAPSIWRVGGRHPPQKKTDKEFTRSTQCVYRRNAEGTWGSSERSKCSPVCGITRYLHLDALACGHTACMVPWFPYRTHIGWRTVLLFFFSSQLWVWIF